MTAWQEFLKGKRSKKDVQEFGFNLIDNILSLHQELASPVTRSSATFSTSSCGDGTALPTEQDLRTPSVDFKKTDKTMQRSARCGASRTYNHGGYYQFRIADPKPRIIHKAEVRDRLVHHAIHRLLYPFFDRTFFPDSFSCRKKKGTHRAINRFQAMAYKVSQNHTKTCWVLKCDIKKFFDSINHDILLKILKVYIPDQKIIWLLENVINSFSTRPGFGLPLGNLTSQLFANVYMNQFDQFVKHKLKTKYYLRYADDFLLLSREIATLINLVPEIQNFLNENLRLSFHPDKLFLKTFASGVDFLGWVHFPDHRVIRSVTKRKMLRRLKENPNKQSKQSYLGMLRHGNTIQITKQAEEVLRETSRRRSGPGIRSQAG